MKCFDCNGTGGDDDCYLCAGNRVISVRKALRNGYEKDNLEEVYEGRCDCPHCHADSCDLCDGMGTITPEVREREITRVLIFGLTQRIPPVIERITHRNGYSRVYDHERLLSSGAAWECKRRGWSWRVNILAFGHELHLHEAGKIEAMKRYPAWLNWLSETSLERWLRWMDETEERPFVYTPPPIAPEILARWADDGGLEHP